MAHYGYQQQPVVGYDPQPPASHGQPSPLVQKTGTITTVKAAAAVANSLNAAPTPPTTGTTPGTTPTATGGTTPGAGGTPATGGSTQVLDDMMANPAFLAAFVQAVYTGDADGVIAVLKQYGFTNITDADEAAVAAALIKPVDQSQLRYIAGLYKITAPTDLQSIPMLISALDGSILFSNVQVATQSIDSSHNVNWTTTSPAYSYTVQFDVPYNADGTPGTPSFSGKATPAGATPDKAVPFTGTKVVPAAPADDGEPPWYNSNAGNEAIMYMSIAGAIGISLISITKAFWKAGNIAVEARKKAKAKAMEDSSKALRPLRDNTKRSLDRSASNPAAPIPDQVPASQAIQDVASAENAAASREAANSVSERKSAEADGGEEQLVLDMQSNVASQLLGNLSPAVQSLVPPADFQQMVSDRANARVAAIEANPVNAAVLSNVQQAADDLGQAKASEENAGADMSAAVQLQASQGDIVAAAEQQVEATKAKVASEQALLNEAQSRGDASAASVDQKAEEALENEEANEEQAENNAEEAENAAAARGQNDQNEINNDEAAENDAQGREQAAEDSLSKVGWHEESEGR